MFLQLYPINEGNKGGVPFSLLRNYQKYVMGFNGFLNKKRNRVVEDFCLILIIYVHCFCVPVFFTLITVLKRFRGSLKHRYYELLTFECKKIDHFVKNKNIIFRVFFLLKVITTYSLFCPCTSYKTVSPYITYGMRFFCFHFTMLNRKFA